MTSIWICPQSPFHMEYYSMNWPDLRSNGTYSTIYILVLEKKWTKLVKLCVTEVESTQVYLVNHKPLQVKGLCLILILSELFFELLFSVYSAFYEFVVLLNEGLSLIMSVFGAFCRCIALGGVVVDEPVLRKCCSAHANCFTCCLILSKGA